jgi:hypothetical protein
MAHSPEFSEFPTVIELVDKHCNADPNYPFFTFSRDTDEPDNPTCVSRRDVVNASHRAAYAFETCASSTKDSKIVAVIANVDSIVYHTAVLGLMRAGYAVGLSLDFAQIPR